MTGTKVDDRQPEQRLQAIVATLEQARRAAAATREAAAQDAHADLVRAASALETEREHVARARAAAERKRAADPDDEKGFARAVAEASVADARLAAIAERESAALARLDAARTALAAAERSSAEEHDAAVLQTFCSSLLEADQVLDELVRKALQPVLEALRWRRDVCRQADDVRSAIERRAGWERRRQLQLPEPSWRWNVAVDHLDGGWRRLLDGIGYILDETDRASRPRPPDPALEIELAAQRRIEDRIFAEAQERQADLERRRASFRRRAALQDPESTLAALRRADAERAGRGEAVERAPADVELVAAAIAGGSTRCVT